MASWGEFGRWRGHDRRPWLLVLLVGIGLLSVGDLFLLLGPLEWVFIGGTDLFALRIPGLLAMVCAWPFLVLSIPVAPRPAVGRDRPPQTRLVLFLLLALLGFVVGIRTLPVALPQEEGGLLFDRFWEYVLLYGYFPYVPSVFAPVVLGHAGFYLVSSRSFRAPADRSLARTGVLLHVALAGGTLGIQLAVGFEGDAYLLVGGLLPGYVAVAASALRDLRRSAIAAPSPDPAAPSPGPWP